MKIRPEHLEAVQQEERARQKQGPVSEAFEDVLARQVDGEGGAESAQGAQAPLPGYRTASIDPLLSVREVQEADNQPATESEVMEHIDSLLTKWENYAEQLEGRGSAANLRQAYGVLASISGEVQGLKQAVSSMQDEGAPLRSVVDELEVLTVTEQFKFNRGDYTE